MMTFRLTCLLLALVAIATGSAQTSRDSWPQWRGPQRSGILTPEQAPALWPPELKKGWSVEIGEGYSSPVSGDGRVFVHARRDPEEVVSAIELSTGKVLWQQKYAAPMQKNPYAKEMAKGPYSTPLLADGRLYTLGTTAIASASNAATGTLLWRRDFSAHIDTSKLFCGGRCANGSDGFHPTVSASPSKESAGLR